MKKIVILLALLLATAQYSYGQSYTVDNLCKELANVDKVERVRLSGLILKLVNVFEKTGVKSAEAYSIHKCTEQVKEEVRKAIANLDDRDYDTQLHVNKKGEKMRVLTKKKDDYISEIVMIGVEEFVMLVRLKGKINPQDIDELTAETTER
jgi:hypothetical protein